CYRAQRNPTKSSAPRVSGGAASIASGPASGPEKNPPPRTSAPGNVELPVAPARPISSSLKPPQPGVLVGAGSQSATHSKRLPTMPKAPGAETPPLRAPVSVGKPTLGPVLQSVVPLSGPGSGDPLAATCHSALVGSRLAELAHASNAWNQLMWADGITTGRLTA